MPPAPNVVLITVDQWRGDCLGHQGHPVLQTPTLDRLARRSTVFTNAYSPTPTCVPARVGLMLGQTHARHGRLTYRDKVPFTETHGTQTLARSFTDAGYQTRCIGKLHVWPERDRIGFDEVELHDGYLHASRELPRALETTDDYLMWLREREGVHADYTTNGLNCNALDARPWQYAEHLHPTEWVVQRGVEFLARRDPTQPFFLNLSFHRPHPPLDPPTWAFDQYIGAEMPDVPRGNWVSDYDEYRVDGDTSAMIGRISPHALQRARAGYFGLMTHIDLQLGRFFEVLGEHGLSENTIIVFTADHGEMLGDHDMTRKGLPYEGSARVPLIVYDPRHAAGESQQLVELADIMPTLLELAAVPVPDSCDGLSLAEVIAGGEGSSGRSSGRGSGGESGRGSGREYLFGEHAQFGYPVHFVRDAQYKYVLMSGVGREQLFDLAADPQETTCLLRGAGSVDVRDRMRNALRQHLTPRPEAAAKVPA